MTRSVFFSPKAPRRWASAALLAAGCAAVASAFADEAEIRKALGERLPKLPRIDEVRPAAVPGLFEVRIGTEVMYTDARGRFLIQGDIIDVASKRNLTQERVEKLTAIDFASLPLKDAIVWKTGSGKRRIAVFADPNCGYCKRLEQDLQDVKNVTVYTFLIPILGGDSPTKARSIWCAKDNTATWRNWMLQGNLPARAMGTCDTEAIDRNVALAQRFKITGTPAIFFEDGTRAPGALSADDLEKRLKS